MQKYPQPGDPNPAVRIGVVGAGGGKTKWISLTEEKDIYIPRFGWVREGLLWAEVLNRVQDKLDLYFVDTRSGDSQKVLTETAPDSWVNVNDDFNRWPATVSSGPVGGTGTLIFIYTVSTLCGHSPKPGWKSS